VSKTIIIADSDYYICKLVSRFLAEEGYTIITASDGYEALDTARLTPPTAILADILLPRLDGFALCRLIKSDDATKDLVTVVLCSTLASEERALVAGADAFMRKPLEKKRLLTTIDQATIKRNAFA
jgi:twitching motility two-component system response regulator PilG